MFLGREALESGSLIRDRVSKRQATIDRDLAEFSCTPSLDEGDVLVTRADALVRTQQHLHPEKDAFLEGHYLSGASSKEWTTQARSAIDGAV